MVAAVPHLPSAADLSRRRGKAPAHSRVPIGSREPGGWRVWWRVRPIGGWWRREEVSEEGMEVPNPPPNPAGAIRNVDISSLLLLVFFTTTSTCFINRKFTYNKQHIWKLKDRLG
jgi:hypothetical protein